MKIAAILIASVCLIAPVKADALSDRTNALSNKSLSQFEGPALTSCELYAKGLASKLIPLRDEFWKAVKASDIKAIGDVGDELERTLHQVYRDGRLVCKDADVLRAAMQEFVSDWPKK